MARGRRRAPKTRSMLKEMLANAEIWAEEVKLPGADHMAGQVEEFARWMGEQLEKVELAIRDEDEVLFERSLASWMKGWERLNEMVAEEYREETPNPESWELRYLKWMKIAFVKFESEVFGLFYIYPRRPKRRPQARQWYTADEMIDILENPATLAAINTFGAMPARAEDLKGPARGEKHLTVDFTGDVPVMAYTFDGGPRYDREDFCRRYPENDKRLPWLRGLKAVR